MPGHSIDEDPAAGEDADADDDAEVVVTNVKAVVPPPPTMLARQPKGYAPLVYGEVPKWIAGGNPQPMYGTPEEFSEFRAKTGHDITSGLSASHQAKVTDPDMGTMDKAMEITSRYVLHPNSPMCPLIVKLISLT